MAPIIKARYEIVCDGCGDRQRHEVPLAQRNEASFACPSCGPLTIDAPWVVPNARRERKRFYGRGAWRIVHGNPRPN